MGVIGVSLIAASLVCFCLYPQPLLNLVRSLRQRWLAIQPSTAAIASNQDKEDGNQNIKQNGQVADDIRAGKELERAAMPPPMIKSLDGLATPSLEIEDEQTTPKATATVPNGSIPSFSLSSDAEAEDEPSDAPLVFPSPFSAQRASGPSLMAPPALSSQMRPPEPSRMLPIPNRGPPAGLAPPPTITAKPTKPSRKVILTQGHSPLDWARKSGPASDLRNLPPSAPFPLRVTPSMLKTMNGRKGRDAWTVLGGAVYNITPYLPFHPGGEGELLRCAGKNGDKLFGEIHPWVNYDTMLRACLIGVMVAENDGKAANQMEEMD
jgi:cytochrome b involved in lipid metabolism